MSLNENEPLTRFLTSSSHFSKVNNRVKYGAFMPHPIHLDLSMFRIQNLTSREIWETGEEQVANPSGRTVHGRADIKAMRITKCGIQINPDDDPPGHVNVIGWPSEKSKQKAIAQELSANASLFLK